VIVTGDRYVFDVAAGLVGTAVGFAAGRLAMRLPRPAPAPEGAIA